MRIVCISDTHGLHDKMKSKLPQGDILIHSGDCTNMGKENEIEDFITWFQSLKGYKKKIFIAGNHDFGFEYYNSFRHNYEAPWLYSLLKPETLFDNDVIYLHDSEFILNDQEFSRPIKIYGSPWQPRFFDWAFNLNRNGWELEQKWSEIPDDTDILITHTPPHGIRDFVSSWRGNENVGCELLRYRLDNMNVLLNVFGHIHEAYGPSLVKHTLYVNASVCDSRYKPINKPIVIEMKEYYGDIIVSYVEE